MPATYCHQPTEALREGDVFRTAPGKRAMKVLADPTVTGPGISTLHPEHTAGQVAIPTLKGIVRLYRFQDVEVLHGLDA